jgi:aminoglycoside phosphotransferase family enzyme/predicted kinase
LVDDEGTSAAESRLIEAMRRPDFYPDHPAEVEFKQTHMSWVFLAGGEVYKVKKPVTYAFADAATLKSRYFLCCEEVRLNRRLAPGTYLGVVPIVERGTRLALADYAEVHNPKVREYAVRMRRLPDDRMLDHLLRIGQVSLDTIVKIAHRLAKFHCTASIANAAHYGSAAAIRRTVLGNLGECRAAVEATVGERGFDPIHDYLSGFISAHRDLLDDRVRQGRVREGHGDLRCEHVCLTDEIDIFDCVEFDEELRYGDVASDLAFLAMDLDAFGAPHLADELIRAYSKETEDRDLATLSTFYKCHRACIRGKVDYLKNLKPEVPPEEQERARERARAKFSLAARYVAGGRPALLVVCGLVASGKSTMAEKLRVRTGFEVFNSDRVRKQLAGIPDTLHRHGEYGTGIYTPAFDVLTYESLIKRARRCLAAGRGAVLDATFKSPATRAAAGALGAEMHVPVCFVECRADQNETLRRLHDRAGNRAEVSDATEEIYASLKREFVSITELPPGRHLVVKTSDDLELTMRRLEAALSDPLS